MQQTDLKDISEHPAFVGDGRPGTYRNGTKSQKIDYVLLSPALFSRVLGGGVFRLGVWGGVNGTLFPHYDTMTRVDPRGERPRGDLRGREPVRPSPD